MEHIRTAIEHLRENNLAAMKDSFQQALYNKAVALLEEKKKVIAQVYFGKK